jgi:putative transposase
MRRGVILKHFSARDVISRWDVVEVHGRATSLAAARFLEVLLDRGPFAVKALQVDGGSEFAAEFEEACQQKQLPLFVLPPKSPKLNAHVERSHRTHHEEFYQVSAASDHLPALNEQLRRWEHTYNCVRPHQSLAYLTPLDLSLAGNTILERQSVTNLLDEYRLLPSRIAHRHIVQSTACPPRRVATGTHLVC